MAKNDSVLIDTAFIERILKKNKLTQGDFADLVGLTSRTLTTILSEGRMKRKYLPAFAAALKLPESALLAASPMADLVIQGDGNRLNNQSPNSVIVEGKSEIEYLLLQREVQLLKEWLGEKDKRLADKDERIKEQSEMIQFLREKFK